jgi:hypothetical protein
VNTAKTPLIQKLILAVLFLILVCLVVIIAQNWKQRRAPAPVQLVTETEEPEQPVVATSEPTPAPVVTRKPEVRRPSPQASVPPPRVQLAALPQKVEVPESYSSVPPAYTALVNPAPQRAARSDVSPPDPTKSGGLIVGRVLLSGTPPPETQIAMSAACARLDATPVTTRHYVVSADHGLANVLVYVKAGLAPIQYDTSALVPGLEVAKCMFEPYVMGVLARQRFQVVNSDPLLHNVHATPGSNREFNYALASQGQTVEVSFPVPELFVRLKCDVHPWEFAYVGVLEHPFFAITDANGDFSFPAALPPGRYMIAAVHLKAGEALQELDVNHSGTYKLKLTLKARGR